MGVKDYLEFLFLNFFNAENQGKRPLHPLETTTQERRRQITDIPGSKTSFVVCKVKKQLKGMSVTVGVLCTGKVFMQ